MLFRYAMKCHQRQMLWAVLLLLGTSVLLAAPNTSPTAARQTTTSCTLAPEAPGSVDSSLGVANGELSLAQKHAAFADVLLDAVRFGEYDFPVSVTQSQRTTFAPVLLKSVAGIESGWTQYVNGTTNANLASCDFGLMQINAVARASLFSKQPSLRSDTRGNIAASAQTLGELWDSGLFGTLPLVNDGDPSWLPNWYYVLSSYNGGPGGGKWVNNPSCGTQQLDCGAEIDYASRRPKEGYARWTDRTKGSYPYQERALNNLPFPLRLAQHPADNIREWLAEGLSIKEYTSQLDTGLFPEDSLFVRTDPSTGAKVSYAPNLILFHHRTLRLVPDANAQTIAFEYDLPFSAQVTITLVLANGTELPLCARAGVAGWNQHYCRATVRLQSGDSYRIRAERGNPDQVATYYAGQYLQAFRFTNEPPQIQSLPYAVHLPLVQSTGQPVALFNRNFSQSDPQADWKPDYWDVQVLASRDPITDLPDIADVVGRASSGQGWSFQAMPGGSVDLRQRVALEPGRYLLRVQVDVDGRNARSVLTVRTQPAMPGPQPWKLVANIEAAGSNKQINEYWIDLDGPTTISLLAAFAPDDSQSAFTLRSVELFR
ncbi:MAG: hypothetical protein OHK0022_48720 [Roseiflexaceae bacterium]